MTRSRFAQTVGEEIRSQRVKLGLTQTELAEAVGVSRASISSWELGEKAISAFSMDQLSNYFERELKRLGMKSVGSAGAGSQTEVQRG